MEKKIFNNRRGYMTMTEMAEYFGVNKATISRWYNKKGLPAHRSPIGRLIFNVEEVEEWLVSEKK